MAQVEPFTALRYTSPELSALIAPPYDVLDEDDKAALLQKSDHNIVALDLPHLPPKTAGPDEAYKRAAGELTSWLDIRVLARDAQPSFYVYHQTYRLGSKALTRRKFFARLRLEPLGSGQVFPHEQTFGGPKEDRLKLTIATQCNLSPIFGLYPDERNEVAALFDRAIDRPPDQSGMLDLVRNDLWAVTDGAVIAAVKEALADRPIFIADGHHRYATAWMYRERQVAELGEPTPGDPVNFVLAVLGGMEDPGATIRPYFRTIVQAPAASAARLREILADAFTWTDGRLPRDEDALARSLSAAGLQAMGLYVAAEDAFGIITPKDADLLAAYEPKRHPAWRRLPYAILHRYLLDEVFRPALCDGGEPTVHYHKTMDDAVGDARSSGGIAVLMPATTMAQLREICTAGELMPQKSTYFYPKLATGLVINPLY